MEMSCWIYCITSTAVFSRQIVLNTTVFFPPLYCYGLLLFFVFRKKQKNKRPEVFTDLLIAEIINISL